MLASNLNVNSQFQYVKKWKPFPTVWIKCKDLSKFNQIALQLLSNIKFVMQWYPLLKMIEECQNSCQLFYWNEI